MKFEIAKVILCIKPPNFFLKFIDYFIPLQRYTFISYREYFFIFAVYITNVCALRMNYQDIVEKINDFLVEDFEVDIASIVPEGALKETLDLDSLDYIDLIVAIESNFGFKIKPEDFQTMRTVKDFYDFVAARLNIEISA